MNIIRTKLPYVGFWDTRQGGRSENQDSCGFIDTPHGLLAIVCDGMGGGPAGKEASTIAVKAIAEYVSKTAEEESLSGIMRDAVEAAHQKILAEAEEHEEMKGMGTTVVAALFNPKEAIVAHVGDSRLYQYRRGKIVFRTQDHSFMQHMREVDNLPEKVAQIAGQTNIITKALGKDDYQAEIDILPYERGDRFVLCTDGIWGAIPEDELTLRASKTPSMAGAVDGIVLFVDENGRKSGNTHDNLTLALFETKNDSTTKVKMNRKSLYTIRALIALCIVSVLLNLVLAANINSISAEKDRLNEKIGHTTDGGEQDEKHTLQPGLEQEKEQSVESEENIGEDAEEKQAEEETTNEQDNNEGTVSEQGQAGATVANIEKVIELLSTAADIESGKKRKATINEAIVMVSDLLQKEPENTKKDSYKNILNELNKPLTMQDEKTSSKKVKGHILEIIKKLKTLKGQQA